MNEIKVGAFVYHPVYGYGEITTVDEVRRKAFIDFFLGHYDWFDFEVIEKAVPVLASDKVYRKVRLGFHGDNDLKVILEKYSDYLIIGICKDTDTVGTVITSRYIMKRDFSSFGV